MMPNPLQANFHSRKTNNTPREFTVGGVQVDLYFFPGDDALGHITEYVRSHADHSAYFTFYAWSDQGLVDTLKVKWEGSAIDNEGTLTGFDIRGVLDSNFWINWLSASVDMTGTQASRESTGNPNTRWAKPAPVFFDAEDRKLHSRTMIIDVCTDSDPTVIVVPPT